MNLEEQVFARAQQYVRTHPAEFAEAGKWLDRVYSSGAARARRRHADKVTPGSPSSEIGWTMPVSAVQTVPPRSKRHLSQATWLLHAVELDIRGRRFHGVNQTWSEMSGFGLTKRAFDDPKPWARRVLVVACLLTDRAAHDYLEGLTELAIPWIAEGEPLEGRAFAARPDPSDGGKSDQRTEEWAMLCDEALAALDAEAGPFPDVVAPSAAPAKALSPDEWWPIGRFPKGMRSRLEKAIKPGRGTLKVERRHNGERWLYRVADVRKDWADDVPEDPRTGDSQRNITEHAGT